MKTNGDYGVSLARICKLPFFLGVILMETRVNAFGSISIRVFGSDRDGTKSCIPSATVHRKQPTTRLTLQRSSKDDATTKSGSERDRGILVLMTVPLAWGTFEPVIRYVYAMEPPIPGLVFSPLYYLVAASALSLLSFLSSFTQAARQFNTTISDNNNNNKPDNSLPTTATTMVEKKDQEVASNSDSMLPILGGMELGFYLVVGNSLQVLGLKTLNSNRVAFLIQLTTVSVVEILYYTKIKKKQFGLSQ
jgi:hypothetical protein